MNRKWMATIKARILAFLRLLKNCLADLRKILTARGLTLGARLLKAIPLILIFILVTLFLE
ncbi:MAG: hypothetical protein WAM70_19850, partial [Pyrinomonadaceae bacterium]